jgi:hypothetical protein
VGVLYKAGGQHAMTPIDAGLAKDPSARHPI